MARSPALVPTGADPSEVVDFLVETQALQFGDFTLKSGERSPFFVDLGRVRTGRALDWLGRRLAAALIAQHPDATLLFGPAYKGIALATAAAIGAELVFARDLSVLYDRKEAKAHGERGNFIGQRPGPEDQIVLVDDVLSSGGTKLEAARALKEAFGVMPVGVLVVVDRTRRGSTFDRKALPVHALVGLPEMADYLAAKGDPRAEQLKQFYEGAA